MTTKRHAKNPFHNDLMVPTRDRPVRVSKLGKDDNVLLNQATGEVSGTHVTSYRTVDTEQFVKIFASNIALAFDLTSAGIKAFTVLMWAVQNTAICRDEVELDSYTLIGFLEGHADEEHEIRLSIATYRRGIAELESAKILAKTMRMGRYFINPSFVFNGDRLAFTSIVSRKG